MPVLSTMSNFDPIPTLALILTPQSGPTCLDTILGDPLLQSIFHSALNTHVLNYKISFINITAHPNNSAPTTYTLDSDVASSLQCF